MFLTVGQTAGPIKTKLGTWIHHNPGTVLGTSRSERHRGEIGGAVGADSNRDGVNAIEMSTEVP